MQDLEHERWQSIVGYESRYDISDQGRVGSYLTMLHGRSVLCHTRQRMLVLSRDADGYALVTLWANRRGTTKKVHHLVLEAFVGPRPQGTECIHLDNNKQNNTASNLKWGTHRENQTQYGTSPCIGAYGETNPASLLTLDDILSIRERAQAGETHTAIALDYPVSRRQISRIIRGERWPHV